MTMRHASRHTLLSIAGGRLVGWGGGTPTRGGRGGVAWGYASGVGRAVHDSLALVT